MLSGVGVNVDFNDTWDAEAVWTNVARLMGTWNYVGSNWMQANPSVQTNALGSPLSDASSYMPLANYPDGVYQVSFKGTANVSFRGVGSLVAPIVKGSDGVSRGQVLVDGTTDTSGGRDLIVNVTSINPSDPLADFKVVAPGYPADGSQMYTNAFLQDLRPFDDVRFLKWELTTDLSVVHWADRAQPDQLLSSYESGRPVDFESMIELGNEAHKDVWLNVPALADDDFVRHLADLVRDNLNPGLKVYIEYSNETWNSATRVYNDVLSAAQANPLITATDALGMVAQQSAFRLKGISDVFRQEFGAGFNRVVPVFGGWTIFPSFSQVGLDFIKQNYGDPSQYIKSTAIAPYMSFTDGSNVAWQTPSSLLATMSDYLDQITPAIQQNVQIASSFGLTLDAYEGGQGVWGSVAPSVALAVQNDPRMFALSQHYLGVWKSLGGGLMNLFTLYGTFWGLKTQVTDAGSPKYDGIVSTLVPAGDATLDGKVDFADFQALAANYGQSGRFWRQGDFNQDGRVDAADLNTLLSNMPAGALSADQAAQVALFGHAATTSDDQAVEFDLFGRSYIDDLAYTVTRGGVVPTDGVYNGLAAGAGPARLGGTVFNKNLGVSSNSRIDVPLAGGFTTFDATIGVDDSAGAGAGKSVFQVLGDGKVLYTSPVMSAGASPIPIEVPIKGVATLSLIVTAVGGALPTIPADWGMARVVASPSTSTTPAAKLAWTVTKNGAPFAASTADSFVFTPSGAGAYVVSVQATDSNGASASRSLSISASDPVAAPSASFAGNDSTLQGSWNNVYGGAGYMIANHESNLPAYVRATVVNGPPSDWNSSTTDVRALQEPGGGATDRVASYWAGLQFTIDVNLTDGQTHRVSLYAVDWDGANRSEKIDVVDPVSGAVLDSQTISSFRTGVYLSWNVSGHVQFRVTRVSGYSSAVISGLFIENALPRQSTIAFAGQDAQTQGSWQGVYGAGGYTVSGGGALAPVGGGSITAANASFCLWAGSTTDVRALQKPSTSGAADRVASCWYGSQFTINVGLTDGQPHKVSLYFLDWDQQNRVERVDVIDPAYGVALDSRTISSFQNGEYLSWTVTGDVQFRITCVGGVNAVVGGVFVDSTQSTPPPTSPPPTSPPPTQPSGAFAGQDSQTEGSWQGVYGAGGYNVLGGGALAPAGGGSITASGALFCTWAASTTDVRALQKPSTSGATDRVAACWYGSQFTVNVNLADGQTHKVSLYATDWDQQNRSERIDLINPTTGAVLDSRTISSFVNGVYLSWNVSGNVQFRITCVGGVNAVVGGVFVDSAQSTPPTQPSGPFVGQDSQTEGSWQGVYGAGGYNVLGGSALAPSGGGSITASGALFCTWAASTTDVRALQKPSTSGATDRVAACWYGSQFTVNVNLADGKTHKVSLYATDWDQRNRSERIDLINPATGAVLDSRTISSFVNGVYLSWNVTGNVQFRVTCLTGDNAVIGGVFVDSSQTTSPSPTQPNGAFTGQDSQTEGSWQGVYGAGGYNVLGGSALAPAGGGSLTASGALFCTWAASTTDVRALQKPSTSGATDRVAACWYGSQFAVNVNLADGKTHKVSLYATDWDQRNRSERIDVIDAATGAVLDSRTISSFVNGVYLSWNVTGDVQFRVTCLTGDNAVIGGVFVD